MVYLLRARSSGWSLRIILQHGGGGARRMRPLAPPPPCWRLILLDTQAQWYGGGCEVEDRDEADLTLRFRVTYQVLIDRHQSTPPPPFLHLLYPPTFFCHQRRPNANPHMLQLISDEGNHFWTTLIWVLDSWPPPPHPCPSFQAANWYVNHVNSPRASKRQVGERQVKSGGGRKERCWKGRIL